MGEDGIGRQLRAMLNQPVEVEVSAVSGDWIGRPGAGVAARVATGLKDPVQVRPIDLSQPIPTKLSEHAIDRWHARAMKDRSTFQATMALVEILESGERVRTRRHPFIWVEGKERNLIYFAIGSDIILPAEPGVGDEFELEIVTCLANPRTPRPLVVKSGRSRQLRRSFRERRGHEDRHWI